METRLLDIVRFAVCLLSVLASIAGMVRAGDRPALRRLAAGAGAGVLLFNRQIGALLYLLLGSLLESLAAVTGVALILVVLAVLVLLPVIAVLRWVLH